MAPTIQRDALLEAINIAALATELCGPPTGHGRNARWHCPNPSHDDHHPSMTVYDGYRNPRWHCHACGAGGTAIDLYATATGASVGASIRALAHNAGLTNDDRPEPPAETRLLPPKPLTRSTPEQRTPDPAIELYVTAAQQLLWSPAGQGARDYLRSRGLDNRELLTINRVGYDPGPRQLPRANGLPRRGSGIVLPVLDDDGRAIFCTTRYFDERTTGRRYDNPASELADNPKVALIHPIRNDHPGVVVITEGIIDALTTASHGHQAIAVLGVGNAGQPLAARIATLCGELTIAIALDGDGPGQSAATRLAQHLCDLSKSAIVLRSIPTDLNALTNDELRHILRCADVTAAQSAYPAQGSPRFESASVNEPPHSPPTATHLTTEL